MANLLPSPRLEPEGFAQRPVENSNRLEDVLALVAAVESVREPRGVVRAKTLAHLPEGMNVLGGHRHRDLQMIRWLTFGHEDDQLVQYPCPLYTLYYLDRENVCGDTAIGHLLDELAESSGVSAPALRDFEKAKGGSDPRQGTVHKWQRALEAAGVQFIDADETGGPGARLRGTKGKR
jgi:hypothetical protein